MVQLTEVLDEEFTRAQPGPDEEEDFTDTDSEISTDSDYSPHGESIAERIYALRDIVPATARGWIYSRWMGVTHLLRTGSAFLGKAAWHVSVSALLFGIPFALLWAEEQSILAMEQEQRMREVGSELLTATGGETSEGDTAGQVGAALGSGTSGARAKPSL